MSWSDTLKTMMMMMMRESTKRRQFYTVLNEKTVTEINEEKIYYICNKNKNNLWNLSVKRSDWLGGRSRTIRKMANKTTKRFQKCHGLPLSFVNSFVPNNLVIAYLNGHWTKCMQQHNLFSSHLLQRNFIYHWSIKLFEKTTYFFYCFTYFVFWMQIESQSVLFIGRKKFIGVFVLIKLFNKAE